MINPIKIFINFLAKVLSKIKCNCHSDCCSVDCSSISSEDYKQIMLAAYQMASQNQPQPPPLQPVSYVRTTTI